eukprot:scaffold2437_cov395-Prasinococcus_capsulatus_cf.AAC.19
MMSWNLSGFDSAGACAGEVDNAYQVPLYFVSPARVHDLTYMPVFEQNYPKALAYSVVLVVLSLGLPVLVSVSVIPAPERWKNGSFVEAGSLIGGTWLGKDIEDATDCLLPELVTDGAVCVAQVIGLLSPHPFPRLACCAPCCSPRRIWSMACPLLGMLRRLSS